MTKLLIKQKVENFDTWKTAFDAHSDIRKSKGSTGGHIYQESNDPNSVSVLLEWDTPQHLDTFMHYMQSDEGKNLLSDAGVVGEWDVCVYNSHYDVEY